MLLLVLTFVSSCNFRTRMVPFQIESIPAGAPVDVNGVNLGNTPTTITLQVSENYNGLLNGGLWIPGNESYNVTVYPPASSTAGLFAQTKVIQPRTAPNGGKVVFDMRLDSVRPKERVDLKITDNR